MQGIFETGKANVVRAERPGRPAGLEMWRLKATVRSTLRVTRSHRRVLNEAGHHQPHMWESQCAARWNVNARTRMEARVAIHVEGRVAG